MVILIIELFKLCEYSSKLVVLKFIIGFLGLFFIIRVIQEKWVASMEFQGKELLQVSGKANPKVNFFNGKHFKE